MNKTSFYGNDLFIMYAPEYETIEDTISKLEYRNEIVNQRIIGIILFIIVNKLEEGQSVENIKTFDIKAIKEKARLQLDGIDNKEDNRNEIVSNVEEKDDEEEEEEENEENKENEENENEENEKDENIDNKISQKVLNKLKSIEKKNNENVKRHMNEENNKIKRRRI